MKIDNRGGFMKYTYRCVFTYDENEKVWFASFPDWDGHIVGCTYGKTWRQALYMADDLLNLMCFHYEMEHRNMPVYGEGHLPCGKFYIKDITADTKAYEKIIKRAQAGRLRFRMGEKARERYWYHKPPYSPEDEGLQVQEG